MNISCFKAYDIRGRIPDQLNEDVAYRVGRAYAQFLRPKAVVVGQDVRPTSPALTAALIKGLAEGGADVLDLGLCGTEEVYFATAHAGADGGIMVTASHNPADFNGMKLVREESRPISGDSGLEMIRELAEEGDFSDSVHIGSVSPYEHRVAYIRHLLSYIDISVLRPFKIVVNAGNGCAGPVLDLLEKQLPLEMTKICHEPDGTFPNGIPNPLLPENRAATIEAVKANRADMGIAWDGDFDRCFLFDEKGGFIEGYYVVGLLAESILKGHPGGKIIHDPRLTWNTLEVVEAGVDVVSHVCRLAWEAMAAAAMAASSASRATSSALSGLRLMPIDGVWIGEVITRSPGATPGITSSPRRWSTRRWTGSWHTCSPAASR